MRILIAAKHAPEGRRPIGGVQSWSRTVAAELRQRGHDVETWGPEQTIPLGGFDYGIIANAGDTARAFDLCDKKINVCHGIIPAEEPARGELTAFTSEEVRDHWGGAGPIIRQPIDTEFWRPEFHVPVYLTRFSYRAGLNFVRNMAAEFGYTYSHVRNFPPGKARAVLLRSGVVLATGRAALEAMSCDIPVVLVDHRSAYQGPLLHGDIGEAMLRNYSGRGGVEANAVNVREAVALAIQRGGMRWHVLEHHSAPVVVDQILGLL